MSNKWHKKPTMLQTNQILVSRSPSLTSRSRSSTIRNRNSSRSRSSTIRGNSPHHYRSRVQNIDPFRNADYMYRIDRDDALRRPLTSLIGGVHAPVILGSRNNSSSPRFIIPPYYEGPQNIIK